MTRKLILFDIDGTLIVSGGAGARAMTRAFAETWGIPDALTQVEIAGRTDSIILADVFAVTGHVPESAAVARFREIYCGHLRAELAANGHGRPMGALPGVRALLDTLAARPDVSLALLTGNYPESAEIKLAHFDLWRYFPWGVFGDEALDRHDLLPVALQRDRDRAADRAPDGGTDGAADRAADREAGAIDPADVIIVGDTPHDVSCAQRGGAKVVAVATGNFDVAALGRCGPDVVCENLADPAPFLALLEARG